MYIIERIVLVYQRGGQPLVALLGSNYYNINYSRAMRSSVESTTERYNSCCKPDLYIRMN